MRARHRTSKHKGKPVVKVLTFLALLIFAVEISAMGRRRVERSLAIVFCLWMLLLSGLAAFNALAWLQWIVIALLVAEGLALLLFLRRESAGALLNNLKRYVLTPSLAVFGLMAVALYYLCQPMVVWWADDLFYWALVPKSMWFLGGLSDAYGSLAGGFGTYTPGMPVMQWQFFQFFGEFREDLLYYTLYLSYGIFLLPLCERINWRRGWSIPVAAVALIALPMLANALSYTFLCVDTALAACFAFVLLEVNRERFDPLAVISGLIGLVLLKQVGVILSFGALALALIRHGGRRSPGRTGTLRVLACWLAPIATLGLWLWVCRLVGLAGSHDESTAQSLTAIFNGTFQWPENFAQMPGAIWYGITHWPTTERLLTAWPILPVPKLFWMLFLCLSPLLLWRRHGKRIAVGLCAFFLSFSAVYLLTILMSFATTFGQEIGSYTGENINNISLLLERYLAPLLLGLGALMLAYLIDALSTGSPAPWYRRAGLTAMTVAIFALCVDWGSIGDTLIPDGYQNREDIFAVAEQTEETNFWADALTDRKNAVILIGFSNDSEYIGNLGYTFAPARFELPVRESGETDTLVTDLRKRHISYVVCLDDANDLYAAATPLAEDGFMDTYTLYRVQDDGDAVTLTLAQ